MTPLPPARAAHATGRRALLSTLLATPALTTCALAASALTSCARAGACTRIAELPLRLVEGYPLVPGSILGQPVSFLLDTGAQGMLVTPEIAAALRLPLRGLTRIYGTGGSQEAKLVLLPGLRLGDAAMPALVAPIAPLPVDLRTDPPLAGLVGAALLARFDLDFDAPRNRVTLSDPGSCAPPPGLSLPLDVSRAGEPYIPVRVNGQPLLALIDTGSRATLLTQSTARRLGLAAPVAASTAQGVDGERMTLQPVRIRLALGDESPTETPASVADLQLDRADMLLGLDVLGRRRLWIGYDRGQVILGPLPA